MNNGYDIRAVANLLLDEADDRDISITNLHANKIIFFTHARMLVHNAKPLSDDRIEAWQYGPVYREIYRGFKASGKNPVLQRLKQVSFPAGILRPVNEFFADEDREQIVHWLHYYMDMSAGFLVHLSHLPDGPWHQVFHSPEKLNPGMLITDDLIYASYIKGFPEG